jgi:hypothetical protein
MTPEQISQSEVMAHKMANAIGKAGDLMDMPVVISALSATIAAVCLSSGYPDVVMTRITSQAREHIILSQKDYIT